MQKFILLHLKHLSGLGSKLFKVYYWKKKWNFEIYQLCKSC